MFNTARNAILFTALLLGIFFCPTVIYASAEERFEWLREQIYYEIIEPVYESDANHQRILRLRQLFADIPSEFASEFLDELGLEYNGNEFSMFFHDALEPQVREEFLDILQTNQNNSAGVHIRNEISDELQTMPDAPFFGFGPLPLELSDRLEIIVNSLEESLALQDPLPRARLTCAIEKLRNNPSVDDRFIKWRHICPSEYGIGSPFVTGCQAVSFKVSQDELYDSVNSVRDVPTAGNDHRFVTHLSSLLVFLSDNGLLTAESLQDINDEIVLTNSYLEKMTTNSFGGGSGTPSYYVHIKNWLFHEQSNPESILFCFSE